MVIRFFSSLIPAYVIERLFWEQRGMTIQMVVYTEIIYAVTIVLLEVPTGILADKWSRKRLLVIGAWLGWCEFVILIFATQFWHFAAAVLLAGIERSAGSGAEHALLYDSLKRCGKEQQFERIAGRLRACDLLGAVLAALSGGVLASRYGFACNYWLSAGSMLIVLAVTMTLTEPKPSRSAAADGESRSFLAYIQEAMQFFKQQRAVRLVVLTSIITGAALSFLDEFWQLYLNRLGFGVSYFGIFSTALLLLRMPGNLLAHTLKHRLPIRTLLLGVTALFAAGLLCAAIMHGSAGLAAIGLIFLAAGMVEPLATGYLHHRLDSSMRATIESFQSLGLYAVTVLAGLGFGYCSSKLDVFGGYGFIAVLCAVFLLYLWQASRKENM